MPSINFILLDETASPNKTVEIIKAIGGTWPFLLTIFGIIFLIIYRKEIGAFLSKFSKISTKSIAGELSLEHTSLVTAATEEFVAPKTETHKNQELDKLMEDKKSESEELPWMQVFKSLKNEGVAQAEQVFEKIQTTEKRSDT